MFYNFKVIYFYYFLVFNYTTTLVSQGLILDQLTYNMASYNNGSKSNTSDLIKANSIDLKPYCPTPGNQMKLQSCTGWALAYAAMSISNAISQEWANQTDLITCRAFSPLFPFINLTKEEACNEDGAGALMNEMCNSLKSMGTVRYLHYDDNIASCAEASRIETKSMEHYYITEYQYIFTEKSDAKEKIENTKLALSKNTPVVISISLWDNFKNAKSNDIIWKSELAKTKLGYHAVTVIGYNDHIKAFEILNSYGPDWGNRGFINIRYSDFGKHVQRGLVIQTNFKKEFKANPVFFIGINKIIRSKDTVCSLIKTSSFTYELNEEVKSEDSYQLVLSGEYEGLYCYLLNIYGTGKKTIFYPRDNDIDDEYFGPASAAFLAKKFVTKKFPTDDSIFNFDVGDSENFIFFFSNDPIHLFERNLMFDVFAQNNTNPSSVLKNRMADQICPESNLSLENNKIKLISLAGKKILPVIIRIPKRTK